MFNPGAVPGAISIGPRKLGMFFGNTIGATTGVESLSPGGTRIILESLSGEVVTVVVVVVVL